MDEIDLLFISLSSIIYLLWSICLRIGEDTPWKPMIIDSYLWNLIAGVYRCEKLWSAK